MPSKCKIRLNYAKAMLQIQLEKFYSAANLFEFHLCYCDKIVKNVLEQISAETRNRNCDDIKMLVRHSLEDLEQEMGLEYIHFF